MERFIADFCHIVNRIFLSHSEQNISDNDVFINLSMIEFNPLTMMVRDILGWGLWLQVIPKSNRIHHRSPLEKSQASMSTGYEMQCIG